MAGLALALPMLLALGAALAWPAHPVAAAAYDRFYANFAGEELMRAMNADRAALGLPALASDATLENLSRDRAVTCPSNASLTIRGRARDMADRGYFSHDIPGCSEPSGAAFSTFDLLKGVGYTFTSVGEDIAANDFASSATTYATGCDLNGGSCRGSITLPATVAGAERGFMESAGHRANILSTGYGRFGCGAWSSSAGNRVYSCYFASNGNGVLDGAGPAVTGRSGIGATFAIGARPTFTADVADSRSVLSDGWAAIDGRHVHDWAWDHAGSSGSVTATAPALGAGRHTFTWWVRDASTRATSSEFTFTVGVGATPTPALRPTPTPTATPRSTSHSAPSPPTAVASAGSGPSPGEAPASSTTLLPVGPGLVPGQSGAAVGTGANPVLSPNQAGSSAIPAARIAARLAGAGGNGPGSGDGGTAALAAIALLLLLVVGLVPPGVLLARSTPGRRRD